MKRQLALGLTLLGMILLAAAIPARGQEAGGMPTPPTPGPEHAVLQKFVGEWESKSEANMGPGQPAVSCNGTASAKMLGGFWVINNSTADGMGAKVEAVQTIGYDSAKKMYVGTWIDSMWNHLWHYEGQYDEGTKTLSLEADGPNFMKMDGSTSKFRDSYQFKSDDEIAVSSAMQDDKGEWVTFMTGTMTRKK